jgi:hypothetical protein
MLENWTAACGLELGLPLFDIGYMFARRAAVIDSASKSEIGLQYRSVSASIVVPRPREAVWAELELADHPAWSAPAVAGEQKHEVRGDGTLKVGDARVVGPFTTPPFGIHQVWWTEVTAIMPGWSITTVTYAGIFDHSETLVLHDHESGTRVRIEGSVRRVTTPEHADLTVGMLQRMADGHLRRAAQWQPGDPPRPIDAFPERH